MRPLGVILVASDTMRINIAQVAQLVEQGFCKPQVEGSSPFLGFYTQMIADKKSQMGTDKIICDNL